MSVRVAAELNSECCRQALSASPRNSVRADYKMAKATGKSRIADGLVAHHGRGLCHVNQISLGR